MADKNDDQNRRLKNTASSIPDQSDLVRFGASTANKLVLVPTLKDQNDYQTIAAMRAELLASNGPIETLRKRYSQNQNLPQASLFEPLMDSYGAELLKEPENINYAVLYARGSRFYAARTTAKRQIDSGEWPESEANEHEAIDAICMLHGSLIMSSAVGRQLVANAHEFETTPEVYQRDQLVIQEFGEVLAAEIDMVEPETAEAILDITEPIDDDPQPSRTRGIGLVLAGSALVTLVGGAAWYAAGGVGVATLATGVALYASAGITKFAWEVVKKTDVFAGTVDGAAKTLNTSAQKSIQKIDEGQRALLKRLQDFTEQYSNLIDRISDIRPEFGWVKAHLKSVNLEDKETANSVKIDLFLPLVSPIDVLDSYQTLSKLGDGISNADWKTKIGKPRTLGVLKKLGIVQVENGQISLTSEMRLDPEATLRYSAIRTETIELARELLMKNSRVSPAKVCEEITKRFGKTYSNENTIVREGRSLLTWARWLEPHLINPHGDSRDASLLAAARSKKAVRGRASLATPANLKRATELFQEDINARQVGDEMGINAEVIRRWVRDGLVIRKYPHPNSSRAKSHPSQS